MEVYRSIGQVPLPHFRPADVVAVKLHMGERGNKTHVKAEDVGRLVSRIKSDGARVFITDTTTLYPRKRATVGDYLETAAFNWYTEERIGCPVIIADADGGRKFGHIHVARGLLDANSLIVFSHATGHITTGFAGAIKNVAMGCVTKQGKRYIHGPAWPRHRDEQCRRCGVCVETCPFGFITLKDRIELDVRNCPACERCLRACQNGGLWRPPGAMKESYRRYAETCTTVISCFERVFYLTELNRVTKFCDCSTNPDPVISPDLGFIASNDPVTIDRESVRMIAEADPQASQVFGDKWESFIANVSKHMSKGAIRLGALRGHDP